MTEEDRIRVIDKAIVNQTRNKSSAFLGATLVGVALSLALTGTLVLIPQVQVLLPLPATLFYVLVFVVIFLSWEVLIVILQIYGSWKDRRMNQEEKRQSLWKFQKNSGGALCVSCEAIYPFGTENCPVCGSTLVNSLDYMWVEVEKS
jgi:hypothetical protein